MNDQHVHVTTHDGDNKDESGIAAIIKALVKNPVATIQLLGFIGGMYGVYYAIQNEITEVRSDGLHRYEQLTAKIDQLVASDLEERGKIDAVYSRGDVRYSNIISKLSSHDIDIAKIVTGMDYLVEQAKANGIPMRAPRIQPAVPVVP